MDGPRAPFQNEIPEIVRFLDSHLRPKEGWSITSEYPAAFSETNLGNIRVITESNQVLSHAVLRPMIIKTPAGLFRAGAIGSVVTSDTHRNQGLSTKTIESCLDAARSHGCDFAILWTSLHDFYRRMGFELVGSEVSVVIDRDFEASAEGLKFLDTSKIAAEALHRLYSQHTVTSLRTIDETRRYLQIPNTRVYTAWDQHGALKAYAIEGKGADLNGYIHEWGGGVAALTALLAHVRRTQARPITIIMPSHAANLSRTLQAKGFTARQGYLGMIKILNPANLIAKIHRYARSLGVDNLVLDARDGKYYMGADERIFATDREQDLTRLIFGPQKASEIHDFDHDTADTLERVMPVPLWIWGWDSI